MPFHVPAICIIYNLVVFESYVAATFAHTHTHKHTLMHSLTVYEVLHNKMHNSQWVYICIILLMVIPRVSYVWWCLLIPWNSFFFQLPQLYFYMWQIQSAVCLWQEMYTNVCRAFKQPRTPPRSRLYLLFISLFDCCDFFYFYFSDTVLL